MDLNTVSELLTMEVELTWLNHFATLISCLTIFSCLFLKIPQIKRILDTKSCEGIYPMAIILEISTYTIMMLYNYVNNYNIMTYLEYPIILVQVYYMLYLVLDCTHRLKEPIVTMAAVFYIIIVSSFVLKILPDFVLTFFVPFCTPVNAVAKIGYAYGIIQAGNADAVSLTTWIISISTNLGRILTVYLDSADRQLLFNFSISACLSASVLATSIYYKMYRRAAPRVTHARRKSRPRCHDD